MEIELIIETKERHCQLLIYSEWKLNSVHIHDNLKLKCDDNNNDSV